jgi:imidazolonepropionase-like amidohydrolase
MSEQAPAARLRNARIVDVRDGGIREGDVVIEGGRIRSVDPRAGQVSQGGDLDLAGAYLLPGLVSCHTHLTIVFPFHETDPDESPAISALRAQRRAHEALQAGVTTVRTVGEMHRADIALRTMAQRGWAESPRIVSAGRSISTTGGHGSGFSARLADGADEFRRAAREELVAGANHIKIFITGGIAHAAESLAEPQMTVDEMQAVVAVARGKGTYVCAHAGGSGPIRAAADVGVQCFEHCYELDRQAARTLREAGATVVPTLGVTRSADWMRAHGFEQWTIDKALGAGDMHLDSIRHAVREGVRLVNGTDIPPGDRDGGVPIAIREMEHMVAAGLSCLQSIQATTIHAAELIGLASTIGLVEPGFAADLVAVRDNPLADIRAMHDVMFVMQGGRTVRLERP